MYIKHELYASVAVRVLQLFCMQGPMETPSKFSMQDWQTCDVIIIIIALRKPWVCIVLLFLHSRLGSMQASRQLLGSRFCRPPSSTQNPNPNTKKQQSTLHKMKASLKDAMLSAFLVLGSAIHFPSSLAQAASVEYTLVINGAYVNVTDANGVAISRAGSLVNETLPGPTLVATEGDKITIRVINLQDPASAEASLHWHGMFQPGTPFMDGVPGVAQCGISVGSEMIYEFTATPAGTHWYHSHSGTQYADGQYGALIVNPKPDATLPEWETTVDQEYIVMVHEWTDITATTEYEKLSAGYSLGGTYNGTMLADVAYPTMMINGAASGTEFAVSSDKSYRFRLINGNANYNVKVSVAEPLQMELVMVDPGTYLQPSMVDDIAAEIGSRYDFIINATGVAAGKYPIYVTDYAGINVASPAMIVVDGGSAVLDTGARLQGISNNVSYPVPLQEGPIPAASRQINLTLTGTDQPYAWGINDINAKLPSTPVYVSGGNFGIDPNSVVVENVKVNETVDILLDNSGTMMTHPFHLHGHEFYVLGMAEEGQPLVLNEVNPVLRDTVNVPMKGQTMIRVVANNPGPWIFHCHIDLHLVAGMAMVLVVGDTSEWPVPPLPPLLCGGTEDFEAMADYSWSQQFLAMIDSTISNVGSDPTASAAVALPGTAGYYHLGGVAGLFLLALPMLML